MGQVQSVNKHITYFQSEGKSNTSETLLLAIQRAKDTKCKALIIFSNDGQMVAKSLQALQGLESKVIVVTLPPDFGELPDQQKIMNEKTAELLTEVGIPVVRGVLPFEEVIIPRTGDSRLQAIKRTLSLISGGLPLCVESIIMACESGYVRPGDQVVAMSSDTAIVATACRKPFLFAPFGMEIKEIICKPSNLNKTKFALYEGQEKLEETK